MSNQLHELSRLLSIFRESIRRVFTTPTSLWLVLLGFFALCLSGTVGFSIYVFYQISQGEFFKVSPSDPAQVETIDRTLLAETVESFRVQARQFEQLKRAPARSIDPSL
jgi:hypothetical protein